MREVIRVTVWNEFIHEHDNEACKAIYPQGMHKVIAGFLSAQPDIEARTATLHEPEHGLTEEALERTDVLTWWGHRAHAEVCDEVVDRVCARILGGMGFLAFHSSHYSKVFKRLMGTSCSVKWRAKGERERLWVVNPAHPIARGLGECFELDRAEMYGEFFDVPPPDQLVFISWFQGGEVFRSGICYYRGMGKVFYFKLGGEDYPIYHHPQVQKVVTNAVRWAAPSRGPEPQFGRAEPIEHLDRR